MPYYLDKSDPELGYYDVEQSDQGWRWVWTECPRGEAPIHDYGTWEPTRSIALDEAADDWEESGSGNFRLAATLRSVASRAAKQERTDSGPTE